MNPTPITFISGPEGFPDIGVAVMPYFITGSRAIPGARVREDSDTDVVILWNKPGVEVYEQLKSYGWEDCGGIYPDDEMVIMRKDQWNLIVCLNHDKYQKWQSATELCKLLSLTERSMRVPIFKIIVDGWSAAKVIAEGY